MSDLTYESRKEKIGDIRCHICKTPWNGHILWDGEEEKLGLRLYCVLCDVSIWMEPEFKLFISEPTGKILNMHKSSVANILEKESKHRNKLSNDHPANKQYDLIYKRRRNEWGSAGYETKPGQRIEES